MRFSLSETVVPFDPSLRLSWNEGGSWPHTNHYGFHEAVVTAHFVLRGYSVLNSYWSVGNPRTNQISAYQTHIFRHVVGPKITAFLHSVLGDDRSGQPDLFVFRPPDNPRDPKIRYPDPLAWFWVESKGIHNDRVESVRETQKRFWRSVAEREDLGLGPERIRLYRAIPLGIEYSPKDIHY